MKQYFVYSLTSPDNKIFIGRSCRPAQRVKELFLNREKPETYNYGVCKELRKFPSPNAWNVTILHRDYCETSCKVSQQVAINLALSQDKKLLNDLDYNLKPFQHFKE